MIVIFDLDGTLADDGHRQHHLEASPQDWDAYYAAAPADAPIWPVIRTMAALQRLRHNVEIWTGRPESQRSSTTLWLERHGIGTSGLRLRMRPDRDYRPANEVKGEWLVEVRRPPDLVFDDRSKCVRWWRERGILCMQVADHDY